MEIEGSGDPRLYRDVRRIDVATFGNFDGIGDGFGLFREESLHFSRTFEVELIAGIAVAVWVGNEVAAL